MVFVRAYNIRRKARTPVPDVLLRHRQAPCPTFEKLRSHLPVGGGELSRKHPGLFNNGGFSEMAARE